MSNLVKRETCLLASSETLTTIPQPRLLFADRSLKLRSRIAKALTRLSRVAKGATLDPLGFDVYADNLEEFSPVQLAEMFTKAEKEFDFFPSAKALRDLIGANEPDPDDEIREEERKLESRSNLNGQE
jgi:hypothetical protein